MEKIIPIGSWDFGINPISFVKSGSWGLRGRDRFDFLTKRAADHVFESVIDLINMADGDIPIHMIALGATESFGPNRNADGFCCATCRKQAKTFTSKPLSLWTPNAHNGARFYFDHENKEPKKSYGYTKAAAFNERMQRVELLVIGNGTKQAAERNGGLILPDDVQEKLARDEFIPVSMSCRLRHDVCVICGNEAPTREDYCVAPGHWDKSKKACIGPDGFHGLGCAENLGKIAAQGRRQYVENPNCFFFDISKVDKPADRTAYGGRAPYFQKAASTQRIVGGAELAELYQQRQVGSGHDFLRKIGRFEERLAGTGRETFATATAFDGRELPTHQIPASEHAGVYHLLAAARVIPTPREYAGFIYPRDETRREKLAAAILAGLPGVFSRLTKSSVELPDCPSPTPVSESTRRAIQKAAHTRFATPGDLSASFFSAPVEIYSKHRRQKQAAEDLKISQKLAEEYALFQVKLAIICPQDRDRYLHTAVVQNAILAG